uniref:Histamine H3 receptor n=1 Tax=Serinus canaria TaxID=9135 RepID=A0A8C9NP61_SERCA
SSALPPAAPRAHSDILCRDAAAAEPQPSMETPARGHLCPRGGVHTCRAAAGSLCAQLGNASPALSAFCIPLYVPYVLTGRWIFGRSLCKLWLVVDYLLCTSSVFNIVLISYDRFLSVTRAVAYRAQQGNTRQAVLKMVMVWVLAFLLYGPAIISWEYISGQSIIPTGECYAEFFYNWYFLMTASTLEFFTPFISVMFFNLSIYLNIQKRTKMRLDVFHEVHNQSFSEETERSPEAKLSLKCCKWEQKESAEALDLSKMAKSLAIIVGIFGICWAPYTLLMIIRAGCHGQCISEFWYETSFWLLWINSAVNPVLYPLCHSSFRRAFIKLLCPKKLKVQPHYKRECKELLLKNTCLG